MLIIVGAIPTILKQIKVDNLIIGEQFEISYNYRQILDLAKSKNIKVYTVSAGQKINIEQDLYFDVLWPSINDRISENILNNNSLVCKLNYRSFSMLFTGDIEKIAENAILEKYKQNLDSLNSKVIKIAHHGSKTSSTKELLNNVNPKIALIGVGKRNKFGHPSDITLENLELINCNIYRTDINGEIYFKINRNGEINKINLRFYGE